MFVSDFSVNQVKFGKICNFNKLKWSLSKSTESWSFPSSFLEQTIAMCSVKRSSASKIGHSKISKFKLKEEVGFKNYRRISTKNSSKNVQSFFVIIAFHSLQHTQFFILLKLKKPRFYRNLKVLFCQITKTCGSWTILISPIIIINMKLTIGRQP